MTNLFLLFSKSRLENLKTGGGTNKSRALNDVELKVKNMIQLSVDGIPSIFDDDHNDMTGN